MTASFVVTVRNRIADAHFARFRSGVVAVWVLIAEDSRNLPSEGPQPPDSLPADRQWAWDGIALMGAAFDTPSGRLLDGDFYPGDAQLPAQYVSGNTVQIIEPGDWQLDGTTLTLSGNAVSNPVLFGL